MFFCYNNLNRISVGEDKVFMLYVLFSIYLIFWYLLYLPRYGWNIAKVGVKHQSIPLYRSGEGILQVWIQSKMSNKMVKEHVVEL